MMLADLTMVAESLSRVLDDLELSVEKLLQLKGQGRQMMSRGNLEGLLAIITAQEELVYQLKALEVERRALSPALSPDALWDNIINRHHALGERLLQLRRTNDQDALLITAFSRLNEEQRRFIEWLHGGSIAYEPDGHPRDGPYLSGGSFDQRA